VTHFGGLALTPFEGEEVTQKRREKGDETRERGEDSGQLGVQYRVCQCMAGKGNAIE